MTAHFKSNRFSLFVAIIAFLVIACNNKADEKKSEAKDTTGAATGTSEAKSPITEGLTNGVLDTLFVDADSVRNLPTKKVVFVFTFRTNDTLTIHGWSAEKDSIFGADPDLELQKYAASAVSYGNGMYFGNMVLKKGDLKELQKRLNNNPTLHALLFAPKIVDVNHVAYDILFSSGSPTRGEKIANVVASGFNANPSPPKTY